MEIILALINTAILLVIFFYQKNRNKLLSELITQQQQLLQDTKNVVSQQAMAITGQSDIVKTAMEYSKAFDLSKIETIIRREVNLEKIDEINKIKKDYEKRVGTDLNLKNKEDGIGHALDILLNAAIHETGKFAIEVFMEPFTFFLEELTKLDEQQREARIAAIKNPILKSAVPELLKQIDSKVVEILGRRSSDHRLPDS